jgi:hypothetical protein
LELRDAHAVRAPLPRGQVGRDTMTERGHEVLVAAFRVEHLDQRVERVAIGRLLIEALAPRSDRAVRRAVRAREARELAERAATLRRVRLERRDALERVELLRRAAGLAVERREAPRDAQPSG